jgi:hypothetical protein
MLMSMRFISMKIHPKPVRHLVSLEQYKMIRRVLQSRQIWFLAGIGSIFVPSRNEKYLITHNHRGKPLIMEWPDLDGEMLWMSPGEAARTELKREFPELKKVGWKRGHTALFDWCWPMVFMGKWQGEGVYVDLVGAYHQIYTELWLDTAFPRGRGRLNLYPIATRLGKWKAARNSLLGITRSRISYGFRGGTSVQLRPSNPFLSPGLWATVQAVLNEVAWQAVKAGAVYVATDGYILPQGQKQKAFVSWLEETGFVYREIAGEFKIKGWGCYSGPHKETVSYAARDYVGERQIRAIRLPFPDNELYITNWWKELKNRGRQ